MSSLINAPSYEVTASLVNSVSAGGGLSIMFAGTSLANYSSAKVTASGAVTANTLKTALNISGGKGYLDLAGVVQADTTSRANRMKITLDGVVIFDATSSASVMANTGLLAVGSLVFYSSGSLPVANPVFFKNSCLIEFTSSLTETNMQNVFYAYRLLS